MTVNTVIRCTLLAVILASFNAVAAAEQWGAEPAKQIVRFADLDLTRSAGVAVLYARIRSAAREVCEPVGDRALQAILSTHRCVDEAIARAVSEVNAPRLTSYYAAKTGQAISLAQK
jgi:UrcA family protein